MATYNATITAITTSKQKIIWGTKFIDAGAEQADSVEEFNRHAEQLKLNYLAEFGKNLFTQLETPLIDGEESTSPLILRTSHVVMMHINFHLPESLKNAAN